MYRYTRTFTNCIETFHWLSEITFGCIGRINIGIFVVMCRQRFNFALLRRSKLTMNIGWNTTHLVMDCWYYWNWFFGDIHVREFLANFEYRWQTLHDRIRT